MIARSRIRVLGAAAVGSVIGLAAWLGAAEPPAVGTRPRVLLALARDNRLTMLLGQYNPARKKWFSLTDPFTPPEPQAPFTLFDVRGKIGEVSVADRYKTPPDVTPWSWQVSISTWDRQETTVALALSGVWPALERASQALPLDDPSAVAAVADFLKKRHLKVPQPQLTQVLRVDLNGDGTVERLVCANSDDTRLREDAPGAIYHLTLLVLVRDGKTESFPLRSIVSYKPAHRSVDEQQRLYGALGRQQVLALTDILQDRHEQVAILYQVPLTGPEVSLFTWTGERVTKILFAEPVFF